MKKVLMIAFHYPPFQGSSGIQRTLKFSRYLPEYDWQPLILTADPRAYPQTGNDELRGISHDVPVIRAFALDTARHLSIHGSYLRWMALPDQWASWWFGAIPAGIRLIRRYQPDIIWSTYPIATAHLIGFTLNRLSGIPWVADFRDSMTEEGYPVYRSARYANRWIERRSVKHSIRVIFTAPGTLRMYAERYPEIPSSRWAIIANGYDEEDFAAVEQTLANTTYRSDQLVLIHSGALYPSERDPTAFFSAVAKLRQNFQISPSTLKIILRGSGNENSYRAQLRERGIDDILYLEPSIPHRDALVEIMTADGLLLFQASNCNHQIPAKIYEYLRSRLPIFGLTDPRGDTAGVLRSIGNNTIVPLDSEAQIAQGLLAFMSQLRKSRLSTVRHEEFDRYSRRAQTREFAKVLDSVRIEIDAHRHG